MGLGGFFSSDSKATETNAAADNQARITTANKSNYAESGAFQIVGSTIQDNTRTSLNSGIQIGTGSTTGDIIIEGSGGESIATLTEYLKKANEATAAANQQEQSFFGNLVAKIGDLIKVKTNATADDIKAEAATAGDEPKWGLYIGLAVAGLVLWLMFGGKKKA